MNSGWINAKAEDNNNVSLPSYKQMSSSSRDIKLIDSINSVNTTRVLMELIAVRKSLALTKSVSPSKIFSLSVLESIANNLPVTREALLKIKGVGPASSAYADFIFSVTRRYSTNLPHTSADTSVIKASVKPIMKGKDKEDSTLIEEQQAAVRAIMEGRNIFLTGSAGTGKSHLLRYIISRLIDVHGEAGVAITASTGIAALNIRGRTVHSFGGIGLANKPEMETIEGVVKNKKVSARWRKTKVLIIDEISMLEPRVLETLNSVAKRVRRSSSPFGGIQVIFVGDFLQLPPVTADRRMCFESTAWEEAGLKTPSSIIVLRRVWRQSDDEFVRLLNRVREGDSSPDTLKLLNSCWINNKPLPTDGIQPTKLYCTNTDVDKVNIDRLNLLDGPSTLFQAKDTILDTPGSSIEEKSLYDHADKVVPRTIQLKEGAQVMLMRNSAKDSWKQEFMGLVNGQRGVVVGFDMDETSSPPLKVPLVRFDTGFTVSITRVSWEVISPTGASLIRWQIPLKLAWAVTVHKSQGTTLSRAEIDVARTFNFGQAYTALSRVTSVKGLWLTNRLSTTSIKADPKVIEYYKTAEIGKNKILSQDISHQE